MTDLRDKIKRTIDQSFGPFSDGVAERMAGCVARLPEISDPQARIAEFKVTLEWYAAQVADCRKLGRDGDVARGKLDRDGGSKARAALNVAAVNGKADAT
jgi:hypothetical protein